MNRVLFDSHCHLDLEPLRSELPRIMQEADIAGVTGFAVPGVHPGGWAGIAALAAENPQIFPAYGIHPMHAESATDQNLNSLSEFSKKGLAIGEIGLDPTRQVPLDLQKQAFREQLRLAVQLGLPVLIHCRRAFQALLSVMREEGAHQVGGIMHAYSGSVEMAREFIRLGFAISISGAVTWKNAVKPLQVARELPLEHLVLETDAPDMAPERHRDAFNRPAWLPETALRVAELREVPFEQVARITTGNVRRILRLGSGFDSPFC
ncbi:MAG: TatD family hydrolase [Desulfuromonadaceae bacterium]|nr:TatD family hydrolase [Desulfuromonadaceae bacterium]